MNSSLIVADAGPLIALARIEHLELLRQRYGEILIPPAVLTELALESQKPGTALLKQAVLSGWLQVVEVSHSNDYSRLTLLLDVGEAEAILLAEQRHCHLLLIDERKGRMVAKQRGLAVIGICGLLLLAKEQGLISLVVPCLNQLSRIGYRISPQLRLEVASRAGEQLMSE